MIKTFISIIKHWIKWVRFLVNPEILGKEFRIQSSLPCYYLLAFEHAVPADTSLSTPCFSSEYLLVIISQFNVMSRSLPGEFSPHGVLSFFLQKLEFIISGQNLWSASRQLFWGKSGCSVKFHDLLKTLLILISSFNWHTCSLFCAWHHDTQCQQTQIPDQCML